ncbi:MAG: histidine phosphatase family protein [Pedosphaera sp.]|nr:histidine phosphatase family protein [Pedosphaera sp.]
MNSTRLYLLRHGEVEARYQRVFGGRIDMELSPHGHAQAAALAKFLERVAFDAIYASPMKRAQQTLAPLAGQYLRKPVILPDLREMDFGVWTGLKWSEVQERHDVSVHQWLEQLDKGTVPEAESTAETRARVEPCLQRILTESQGKTVAVVCHGGIVRTLLALLLDLPIVKTAAFEIDYASLTVVDHRPNKVDLQLLNFTPWRDHL